MVPAYRKERGVPEDGNAHFFTSRARVDKIPSTNNVRWAGRRRASRIPIVTTTKASRCRMRWLHSSESSDNRIIESRPPLPIKQGRSATTTVICVAGDRSFKASAAIKNGRCAEYTTTLDFCDLRSSGETSRITAMQREGYLQKRRVENAGDRMRIPSWDTQSVRAISDGLHRFPWTGKKGKLTTVICFRPHSIMPSISALCRLTAACCGSAAVLGASEAFSCPAVRPPIKTIGLWRVFCGYLG